MGRGIFGLLSQLIVTTTIFAVNMLLLSFAGLLRLLPAMLPMLGRLLWAGLILSCRLYSLLLTRAAPLIERRLRINVLEGLARLGATLLLSLFFGVGFLLLAEWPIMIWTVAPILLHGLLVALVWDEFPAEEGLRWGMRL